METASGTLLYDGECGFCSTCVRWLIARQSDRSTLCFMSSSDVTNEGLGELSLTRRDVDRYLWWIGPTGNDRGATAIARALLGTGGVWRWWGTLLLTPPISFLAPWAYRMVARYRYRLPGATPNCRVD